MGLMKGWDQRKTNTNQFASGEKELKSFKGALHNQSAYFNLYNSRVRLRLGELFSHSTMFDLDP